MAWCGNKGSSYRGPGFKHPHGGFTSGCNSSSRGSNTLFSGLLWAPSVHMIMPAYLQAKHSKTQNKTFLILKLLKPLLISNSWIKFSERPANYFLRVRFVAWALEHY